MSERAGDTVVAVVGGGAVGAALACALGHEGIPTALVEARPPRGPACGDPWRLRVSALTEASRRMLQALGAWQALASERLEPIRGMEVWDAAGSGRIRFDADELGLDAIGYIAENEALQGALWQRLESMPAVRVVAPARVEALQPEGAKAVLALDTGEALEASLVVAADGRDSPLRRAAGVPVRGWEYDQSGLVAAVRPAVHHGGVARQRFLPTGPLAFLPLPDGACSIVWSVPRRQAEALLELPADDFAERLGAAFGHALGPVLEVGERAAFPLRLQHATRYAARRLVLAGDAAHAIHPLAGQGLNLGLMDAAALAEVLIAAWRRGGDLGDPRYLHRYERWRKGENLAMMAVMDAFKRMFGSSLPPLVALRGLGLRWVDRALPLKRSIMRRAMGLSGDLPMLARGEWGGG